MDLDLDSDLWYVKEGGFDLDLTFNGFDLKKKKMKSMPNPSLIQKANLVIQQQFQCIDNWKLQCATSSWPPGRVTNLNLRTKEIINGVKPFKTQLQAQHHIVNLDLNGFVDLDLD